MQRALEVYAITGQPLSDYFSQQKKDEMPPFIKLIVAPEQRSALHAKIAARFDQMLAQGLIAEVEALRQRGDLHPGLPSVRCVGYRQVWAYLDGEYDYPTMRDKAIAATRQLAKRQFTWLRKEQNAAHFLSEAPDLNAQALDYCRRQLLAHTAAPAC